MRVVLKPDNFLEVYTSNIFFNSAFDKPFPKLGLSKIDDNNFLQLEFKVIQSLLLLLPKQAEVLFDKNDIVNADKL